MNAALGAAAVAFALAGLAVLHGGTQGDGEQIAPDAEPPPAFYRYDELFKKHGKARGVPWQWLKAICMNESELGENPRVKAGQVSSDGLSWGIMQLTLPTANDFEKVTAADLRIDDTSVRVAARFIRSLMLYFPQPELRWSEWVVKAYNQGQGNTNRERAGHAGYADDYWSRFKRNLARVEERQGKVS